MLLQGETSLGQLQLILYDVYLAYIIICNYIGDFQNNNFQYNWIISSIEPFLCRNYISFLKCKWWTTCWVQVLSAHQTNQEKMPTYAIRKCLYIQQISAHIMKIFLGLLLKLDNVLRHSFLDTYNCSALEGPSFYTMNI